MFSVAVGFGQKIAHMNGTYDLDGDQLLEFIALELDPNQDVFPTAVRYYEIDADGYQTLIWEFTPPIALTGEFVDAKIGDMDGDGSPELILVMNLSRFGDNATPHVFVATYAWDGTHFSEIPSAIPGIVEDMVQVILNIKELQVEQFVDEVVELELIGEGPCVIKAGDISTFEKAEILNPDLVLATLQNGATVSMTMYSRFNKGYVTSEDNQQEDLPVGTIYLDSNHSPVSRINYDVVNSRVDQKTDYDRLNFELWTNGSVKPTNCLAYAAKIIKEHMDVFINFDESSIKDEPEEEIEDEPLNENLYRSVSELELSVRSINCLQNAKIETIGDLVQKSEQEMLKTKNFGRKSLNEIKVILTEMGLSLGTEVENFDPMNNPHTN